MTEALVDSARAARLRPAGLAGLVRLAARGRSLWVSATPERDWLRTVDFDPASTISLALISTKPSKSEKAEPHPSEFLPLQATGSEP